MPLSRLAHIAALIEQSEQLTYSDAEAALRLAEDAVHQVAGEGDTLLAVQVLLRYATMQLIFGQIHEGQHTLLKALTIAEKEDFEAVRGDIMQHMAAVYYTIGEYDEAMDYWADCLDPANTQFTLDTHVHAHIGLGQIYFAHENYAMALAHHHRAERMAGGALPATLRCRILVNIASDCLRLSRLDEAACALNTGLELAKQTGQQEYLEEILVYQCTLAMDRGDTAAAALWLEQAQGIKHVCLWGQNLRLLARGRLHLMQGEFEQALTVLLRGLELAAEMGVSHKAFQAHHLLAQTYTRLGRPQDAEQHHRRYLEVFTRIVRPGTYSRLQQLELRFRDILPS